MSITLTLDNRFVRISGADRKTVRVLDEVCSYKVEGHVFAPSFREGRWDGKEHLLARNQSRGLHAPRGMAVDIAKALKRRGLKYKVEHETAFHGDQIHLVWNPEVEHRGYQNEGIAAMLGGPVPGCGILKMPIRSGKTKTAAGIIARIRRRTLFIVPSKSLLYQTKESLEECFVGETVGLIGDSVDDERRITVASIHTLAKWRSERSARWKEVMSGFDLVIFDEAHHIRGDGGWHRVMRDLDARFKIGLSATAFLDNESEQGRGIIWLKATCGPIRFEVPMKRLVDEGYLMRQNVRIIPIEQPDQRGKRWSATLRRRCIIENETRNRRIVKEAREHVERGLKVVIIARFHDHINMLVEGLVDEGLDARPITGKHSQEERADLVDEFNAGRIQVLIGTVIGEGVDIPSIEVVINAEGGKDAKATIQRQRNLTISDGKQKAVLIDFLDRTNEIFEKHSKERIAVYTNEPAFTVEQLTG